MVIAVMMTSLLMTIGYVYVRLVFTLEWWVRLVNVAKDS